MIIYTVTYNRKERTEKALDSIREAAKDYTLVIVDNNSTDGITEKAMKVADVFIPLGKNIGKGPALNNAIIQTRSELFFPDENGLIAVIDSDIFIPDPETFFPQMEETFLYMKGNHRFGMISANQNDGHIYNLLTESLTGPHGVVKYNDNNEGIASACTVTDYHVFARAGWYRTTVGIYGGHDGFLMHDILVKTTTPKVGVAMDIHTYHPMPEADDAEYEVWKKERRRTAQKTGYCGTDIGFFDKEE